VGLLKTKKSERGFTIAEVSIASAIFSVILLIALAIFFGIGRLFYKGISVSQTQEVTQQIYQDIVGNFQGAASVSPQMEGNSYTYYCVGNTRYTLNFNNEVDLNNPESHAPPSSGGNFGILKDTLPGNGSACDPPCNDQSGTCGSGVQKFQNPTELLGQNMRISRFSIAQVTGANPNLYTVSITVAYGDTDLLDGVDGADTTNPKCKGDIHGSEFCSVNNISTTVYRGLNF